MQSIEKASSLEHGLNEIQETMQPSGGSKNSTDTIRTVTIIEQMLHPLISLTIMQKVKMMF